MRLSGGRSNGRGSVALPVLRAVLALVLLVPIVTLFSLTWQADQEDRRLLALERHGVTYVKALISVELALAESQTATMTGRSGTTITTQPLGRAIQAAASADAHYGDELRTHERWTELRTRVESLGGGSTDAVTAYAAAEETAELLLALIEKVRTNSHLIRDPAADTYYLQDAAAQELPEAIVVSSRLVGLALLTVLLPTTQDTALADLLSAKASLTSNVADLADDVRQTVDTTSSSTLGGALLAPLDRFRQAADTLIPAATAMRNRSLVINPSDVTQSWAEAQSAATTLGTVMLSEVDGLLLDRQKELEHRASVAIGVLVLAVLLVVVPPIAEAIWAWRRRRRRPGPVAPAPAPAEERAAPSQAMVGLATGGGWERSGAAR